MSLWREGRERGEGGILGSEGGMEGREGGRGGRDIGERGREGLREGGREGGRGGRLGREGREGGLLNILIGKFNFFMKLFIIKLEYDAYIYAANSTHN